jgi:predicted ABC-type exoprotein transport system permease subunit
MLPFDRKPWARSLAATVIVVTLVAAVLTPFYLRHIRHLDPPMAVLIVLLVLAIVPPNLVIVRRHREGGYGDPPATKPARPAYATRSAGH